MNNLLTWQRGSIKHLRAKGEVSVANWGVKKKTSRPYPHTTSGFNTFAKFDIRDNFKTVSGQIAIVLCQRGQTTSTLRREGNRANMASRSHKKFTIMCSYSFRHLHTNGHPCPPSSYVHLTPTSTKRNWNAFHGIQISGNQRHTYSFNVSPTI